MRSSFESQYTIKDSQKGELCGVKGTWSLVTARVIDGNPSHLYRQQSFTSDARYDKETRERVMVNIRFDDDCKNGHNSFAITCDSYSLSGHLQACGCQHELVARMFPEIAHLIRWHLVSSDGPMHYIDNVVYMAGDRDYNGLRKGEQKPLLARDGIPHWQLCVIDSDDTATPLGLYPRDRWNWKGQSAPLDPVHLEWRQQMITGKGKERDLKAARSVAVWPEATDDDLIHPGLKERLEARLPGLLEAFRRDVEAAGFSWEFKP